MKPVIKKHLEALKKPITKTQCNALMSILNNSRGNVTKEDLKPLIERLNEKMTKLTKEHQQQGYDWLMNLWKSPNGKERKNNPFGYREQAILENYSHIEMRGYYDAGNAYRSFCVPLYEVTGDNTTMEYYVSGGQIHIIG